MAGKPGERAPLMQSKGENRSSWWGRTGKTAPPSNARRSSSSSSSSRRRRACAYCRGTAGVVGAGVLFAVALLGMVAIFGSIEEENDSRSLLPRSTDDATSATITIAAASVVVHSLEEEKTEDIDGIALNVNWARQEDQTEEGATAYAGVGVATSKPNVFFIMIDDMGWNDIGYQSTDLMGITPNLDKLAAGGVKLTQYYSMSICTPARASFMTGRYTIRYGLQYDVIQPGAPWGLPLTEKILPQYMKDAGYETHMVGKWHLGSYGTAYTPYRRGFDTYLGYLNDEEMYWTHQIWTAKLDGRKFFDFGFGNATDYYDIVDRSGAPIPPTLNDDGDDDDNFSTGPTSSYASSSSSSSNSFKGKYSTAIFQERAMEIIRDKTPHDENPLFLYLAHQAVHDPLGPPPSDAFTAEEMAVLDTLEESSDSTLRLRFAKVLMYLDKTIGELVTYLEQEGWMENSIIVVASDNGGCPGTGGSNYPLRGLKHSYWEGGVKVPALVYSTSHVPEEAWGTEYSELMHVTDWLPTFASAVDFDTSGSNGDLDGVDHWAHMTSPALVASSESPRREMLYNFDPYILWADGEAIGEADYPLAQGAYRLGKWKFIFKVWCQGYYTFDKNTLETDYLTNSTNTCQDVGSCSKCGEPCVGTADEIDGLFDIEADPREETNVMDLYPEVVNDIRARLTEIVAKEYVNSSYEDINTDSYEVWAEHGWWVIPWIDLLGEQQ